MKVIAVKEKDIKEIFKIWFNDLKENPNDFMDVEDSNPEEWSERSYETFMSYLKKVNHIVDYSEIVPVDIRSKINGDDLTWGGLKVFANKLEDGQLGKNVVLWRECEAISKISPMVLSDDMYVHVDGSPDGCFPLSEMDDENIGKLVKVYDKGDPLLLENF